MKTVIEMAREAGFEELFKDSHDWVCFTEEIERFAALVAAHVRETEFKPDWNKYQQGLADGAAAEREACAKLCDELHPGLSTKRAAEHIRARRKK